MIPQQQLRYQSYLLRCWEEADESSDLTIWRFSLEDPRTNQRHGYANLTELVIALHTELFENRTEDENKADNPEPDEPHQTISH